MTINILLSTYNGEKYLREQFDSLLNQTYSDWVLIVRDDGSIDNTLSIIEEYQKKYPEKIEKLSDTTGNAGVIRSFEILLKNSSADYILFCDQDDVWLPQKIELSFQKMQEMESLYGKIPLLVHTDLMIVDENLQVIHDSFWKSAGIQPKVLDGNIHFLALCNSVTGCTVMINKEAKNKILPFPNKIKMHDEWMGICTMKHGKMDYLPIPTIKYRQHGKNQCGAAEANYSLRNRLLNIKNVIEENIELYKYHHSALYKTFLHYLYYKIKYFYKIHYF
jgi:glycosyltransferase involved in cell wall biosynthesis